MSDVISSRSRPREDPRRSAGLAPADDPRKKGRAMAKNWMEAQAKEKAFWTRIYVEKQPDIRSYTPIDSEIAIDFMIKTLRRHRVDVRALDGKTVADIGCGP